MANESKRQKLDVAGDHATVETNYAIASIISFNELPEELLMKIFKFHLNKMSSSGFSHQDINSNLNNICSIGERFCHLINNALLPDPDLKFIPALYIAPDEINWIRKIRQEMSGFWRFSKFNWSQFPNEIHPEFIDQLPVLYVKERVSSGWSNIHLAEYTQFDLNQLPSSINLDCNELPTLYVRATKDQASRCKYTDDAVCYCWDTIRREARYKLKLRFMILRNLNLFENCIPKAISDEHENLASIIELYIGYSRFDADILNNILASLPNVRRLKLQNLRNYVACEKNQSRTQTMSRTLDYLSLDLQEKAENILEFVLAKLPARVISARMENIGDADLYWIRQYLLVYKTTVEHFGFKLRADKRLVSAIFQGFSHNIRRDSGGSYEVISSSCPKSIADEIFSGI